MFVRWNNLTLEGDEQRALPGYRDAAVVRRFDAPEALDVRFYEVQARSVLNRVPKAVPDAVPVDDQSVPGMHACVQLLRIGSYTHPHGRRRRRGGSKS